MTEINKSNSTPFIAATKNARELLQIYQYKNELNSIFDESEKNKEMQTLSRNDNNSSIFNSHN